MPPKQRQKNNAQIANSARAAELLMQHAGDAFNALTIGGANPFEVAAAIEENRAPRCANLDADTILSLKKLSKKDPITREKALCELLEKAATLRTEQIETLHNLYLSFYYKLLLDGTAAVRLNSFRVMRDLLLHLQSHTEIKLIESESFSLCLVASCDKSSLVRDAAWSFCSSLIPTTEHKAQCSESFMHSKIYELCLRFFHGQLDASPAEQYDDEESKEMRNSRIHFQALGVLKRIGDMLQIQPNGFIAKENFLATLKKLLGNEQVLRKIMKLPSKIHFPYLTLFSYLLSDPIFAQSYFCKWMIENLVENESDKTKVTILSCVNFLLDSSEFCEKYALKKVVIPKILQLVRLKRGHYAYMGDQLCISLKKLFTLLPSSERQCFVETFLESLFANLPFEVSAPDAFKVWIEITANCLLWADSEVAPQLPALTPIVSQMVVQAVNIALPQSGNVSKPVALLLRAICRARSDCEQYNVALTTIGINIANSTVEHKHLREFVQNLTSSIELQDAGISGLQIILENLLLTSEQNKAAMLSLFCQIPKHLLVNTFQSKKLLEEVHHVANKALATDSFHNDLATLVCELVEIDSSLQINSSEIVMWILDNASNSDDIILIKPSMSVTAATDAFNRFIDNCWNKGKFDKLLLIIKALPNSFLVDLSKRIASNVNIQLTGSFVSLLEYFTSLSSEFLTVELRSSMASNLLRQFISDSVSSCNEDALYSTFASFCEPIPATNNFYRIPWRLFDESHPFLIEKMTNITSTLINTYQHFGAFLPTFSEVLEISKKLDSYMWLEIGCTTGFLPLSAEPCEFNRQQYEAFVKACAARTQWLLKLDLKPELKTPCFSAVLYLYVVLHDAQQFAACGFATDDSELSANDMPNQCVNTAGSRKYCDAIQLNNEQYPASYLAAWHVPSTIQSPTFNSADIRDPHSLWTLHMQRPSECATPIEKTIDRYFTFSYNSVNNSTEACWRYITFVQQQISQNTVDEAHVFGTETKNVLLWLCLQNAIGYVLPRTKPPRIVAKDLDFFMCSLAPAFEYIKAVYVDSTVTQDPVVLALYGSILHNFCEFSTFFQRFEFPSTKEEWESVFLPVFSEQIFIDFLTKIDPTLPDNCKLSQLLARAVATIPTVPSGIENYLDDNICILLDGLKYSLKEQAFIARCVSLIEAPSLPVQYAAYKLLRFWSLHMLQHENNLKIDEAQNETKEEVEIAPVLNAPVILTHHLIKEPSPLASSRFFLLDICVSSLGHFKSHVERAAYINGISSLTEEFLSDLCYVVENFIQSLSREEALKALQTIDPLNNNCAKFSAHLFFTIVSSLPTVVRSWFTKLNRAESFRVSNFFRQSISPLAIERELQKVRDSIETITAGENPFRVRTLNAVGEIVAQYEVEETTMQLTIALPTEYPLRVPTVALEKAVVQNKRAQRWIMQLSTYLNQQNGSLADGIGTWRKQVDKDISGAEACAVCMMSVCAATHQLPRVPCRQCKKKFHSSCLYQWFEKSNNSTCPLCRANFT